MSERVQFGPFSFDPESRTLERQGLPVRLQPQPARLLAILIDRAGDVVLREQLRQQIWPEGTFVDFERALNFSIARIRAALKDTADSPHYIETIPKHGYRFIAPVMRVAKALETDAPAVVDAAPGSTPSAAVVAVPSRRRS